jgi:glycosyltransferase involved in cell wall biosynthesis
VQPFQLGPMSSVLRAPEVRFDSPAAARHEAERPSICFVGLSNLAVLAPQVDRSGASGEPLQHTLLATALARRGYRVSMVVLDHGQPDGAVWEGVQTFKAYALEAGLPVLRYVHPRWTGLVSALSRADADVYYSSCAGGLIGQIGMFCARRGKRFVFRTASDADCKPNALICMGPWYRRDKWLYERGLRRASSVLVQSVHQQELMRRNFGLDSSIAGLVVEPGSSEREFGERDIDALWVSNMRSVKRPDVLLSVADRLPKVSFHMVGGSTLGAARFFETVKAQAASRSNVTFHGAVAYRNVSAFYSRARVFVNTSDVEGFPNTYLQAWSSGTPVVAFFDPDGVIAREGLGATVRTAQEMSEAVRRLTSDESEWKATRRRCLAFIERHYSEDVVLQPYLQTFHCK